MKLRITPLGVSLGLVGAVVTGCPLASLVFAVVAGNLVAMHLRMEAAQTELGWGLRDVPAVLWALLAVPAVVLMISWLLFSSHNSAGI